MVLFRIRLTPVSMRRSDEYVIRYPGVKVCLSVKPAVKRFLQQGARPFLVFVYAWLARQRPIRCETATVDTIVAGARTASCVEMIMTGVPAAAVRCFHARLVRS